MGSCVAFGCHNATVKKVPGVTFHRFPKKENLKNKWIIAIRRKNWKPTAASRVCSDHFQETDFDRSSPFRVRLNENTVPSIFKAFPSYLQTAKCKRRQPAKRHVPQIPDNSQKISEATVNQQLTEYSKNTSDKDLTIISSTPESVFQDYNAESGTSQVSTPMHEYIPPSGQST